MSKVKWGILGPGRIADRFVSDMRRSSTGECVAVGSRDLGRAQSFAARHGFERAYGTYEELVADPEVEVVYVASPHSHHYEHASLAIAHGKAVLVEKPIAMSTSEVEALRDHAQAAGVFLMEAMWTLCNPLVTELGKHVHDRSFGPVRSISASLGPLGLPADDRRFDPDLGGGVLREALVYPLSLMSYCAPHLRDPERVSVAANFVTGVDSYVAAILEFAGGEIVAFDAGFVPRSAGVGDSRFRVIGESGWAELSESIFNPSRLVVAATDAEPVVSVADTHTVGMGYQIDAVNRSVRNRSLECEQVPLSQSLDVMRLVDRIAEDVWARHPVNS